MHERYETHELAVPANDETLVLERTIDLIPNAHNGTLPVILDKGPDLGTVGFGEEFGHRFMLLGHHRAHAEYTRQSPMGPSDYTLA